MGDVPDLPAPSGVDADAWAAAVAAVRAFCGWHIAPSVTDTITLDGGWSSVLILPSLHVTAIGAVVNDGTTIADPDWSPAGMVRRSDCGVWSGKYQGVSVTFTHGYDDLPMDLEGFLREAASRGNAGSFVSQVGQVRYSAGVAGTPGAASFAGAGSDVLAKYRLPGRP